MKIMKWIKLVVWLLAWQLPSIVGVQYAYGNMGWYRTLTHPIFSPPDALFGIMWSILYIALGISAFLAFDKQFSKKALWLCIVQLVLNACWTPVFFGAHSLAGALVLIVLMVVSLVFLMRAYYAIRRASAWLLVPYGLWLLFATYLTAATWWLN